jgi:hypothetical protein
VTSFIDRFAEQLSEHTDEDDVRAGRGAVVDPGGDIEAASEAIGVPVEIGRSFFNRICKQLGPQASRMTVGSRTAAAGRWGA